MLASIRKFSKTVFAKIFIAIIALPFLLWGMGDVFRSGKQNVLVEINDEKVNSDEFVNYLQKINLSDVEIKNINKTNLLDDILTNYISEKIIEIEYKKKGIQITDEALKEIIVSDKEFKKDDRFSRTKYQKFLLKNNYSAPTYERYLKNIEQKGQLLNYYSGGIKLPNFMIEDLYKTENKSMTIEYINLNEIYSKKINSEEEINKFYNENKKFFNDKFVSFKYLKLDPRFLTGKEDIDESFFKKLDEIENDILDGKSLNQIIDNSEKHTKTVKLINSRGSNQDGIKNDEIDKDLLTKIFLIKQNNSPKFINLNNNYYIAEIFENKDIALSLKDKELKNTINLQLSIRNKIEENTKLSEKINNKKFVNNDMVNLSKNNNVQIQSYKINGMNDEKKFNKKLLKKIYEHNKGEIFLLNDTLLDNNFIVRIVSEKIPSINKGSEDLINFSNNANGRYIAKIYKSYDKYINQNYKIDLNQKVLERLKNSF